MAAELTSNVINYIPIHLVVIVHLHELLKKILQERKFQYFRQGIQGIIHAQ